MRATTRRRIAVPAAITSGLLVSGLLVWHTSYAAFTATTDNNGNSFRSGSVTLTNDRPSSVMFNATGMAPGNPITKCITVEYTGSVPATVTMAAQYPAGAPAANTELAQYLNLEIEEIPVGTVSTNDAACAGATAVAGSQVLPAQPTLADKVTATSTAPGTGLNWTNASTTTRKQFRFIAEVAPGSNNAAQNKRADVNFVWTATSNPS